MQYSKAPWLFGKHPPKTAPFLIDFLNWNKTTINTLLYDNLQDVSTMLFRRGNIENFFCRQPKEDEFEAEN